MSSLKNSEIIKTTKISKEDSENLLNRLVSDTSSEVKRRYAWYVSKGYWPMRAQKVGQAEKEPRFIVNHHTGGSRTNPAVFRFLQSKMASSNAVIERDGNILALADHHASTYHAILRTDSLIQNVDLRRALRLAKGFVDEYGIETVGNGLKWFFEYEQFISIIALQRLLKNVYPTISHIKSHRELNAKDRPYDPGPLYFLPLVEHAVFNDIELDNPYYWLEDYKKNQVEFSNNVKYWFKILNLEERDEWPTFRNKKFSESNFLKL